MRIRTHLCGRYIWAFTDGEFRGPLNIEKLPVLSEVDRQWFASYPRFLATSCNPQLRSDLTAPAVIRINTPGELLAGRENPWPELGQQVLL